MKKQHSLRLGIVGGLGALAGADLLNRIVQETPIKSEGDHRELVFEQKPMREPLSPMNPNYSPTHRKLYVFDALSRMERDGCSAALLPCFITHCFLSELEDELNLKLISMTEAIKEAVEKPGSQHARIGVITTPYVRKNGLFQSLFGEDKCVVFPSEMMETAVMHSIYGENGFKSGNRGPEILGPINAALSDLQEQGATVFVPGLTELPLLFEQLSFPDSMTAINTATLYARHALALTEVGSKRKFKVGIVGGIGPAATVDFMSKLVKGTNAARDQDHIKILVEQNPQIPDRTENLVGGGTDPTVALYSTCKKLERGGADILAIPCNTAHAYVDRIQRHLDVPIISILSATTDAIRQMSPRINRVGILATNGTIQSGLYQQALDEARLDYLIPDDAHQALVMDSIYGREGVKAGFIDGLCKQQIRQAFDYLVENGAEAVILGCTELPLIVSGTREILGAIPIDPTDVLARKCVQLACEYGK
ncbi:aspartate/glutamate racemase family protein [Granulosicoccus antarcticus]|uniref:Aspartate racemase n=1 Tax=Granulosicoccus antarcticus IMCC3135 TaxID=1192854 RepID=A0A2Z2NT78_9GAMM|nr:amino acid racemase [Granulosicoccus antarcticus]ASJ73251.1 Aspartate racemase [Granulosicoccus antarcticus IMCC3135]